MLRIDKDMERVMMEKKKEILFDLEKVKKRILTELNETSRNFHRHYTEKSVDLASKTNQFDQHCNETLGNITLLSEQLNDIKGDSVNLFNASSEKNRTETFINSSGYVSLHDCTVSHPIFMKQGCTYQYPHDNYMMGGNRIYAVCDSVTGDVISVDYPVASDDGVYNFITPLADMWVAVNVGSTDNIHSFMVCEASEYPESYVPYGKTNLKDGIVQITEKALPEIMPPISPEMTTFVELKESENLFNKNAVVNGGYYNGFDGAVVTDSKMFRCLIPVKAGVYSFAGATNYFGNNTIIVPLFDANENFVTSAVGVMGSVINSGQKVITYNITEEFVNQGVVYAGYSVYKDYLNTSMYVNSYVYPTEYITFGNVLQMPKLRIDQKNSPLAQLNTLYGKTAVFDGDSICAGVGDGWAGRIGIANKMNWQNVSVGGGTITSELYKDDVARHWLSTNIDTIHDNYPELDYLILEGGTNDADLLSDAQIGTLDANDFSGGYDATTFYGALDTLFYKALSYYPNAKIGFIIAHRMGTGTSIQTKRRAFFERVIEVCNKWAIPYIDLWNCSQLNPNLISYYDSSIEGNTAATEAGKAYFDAQHLTSIGYEIITPKIEAWMRSL